MYSFICSKINELERKYKSRNIYEIIEQSSLHLMKFQDLGNLKGFYTLCLNQQYIGYNANLEERKKDEVICHEFGHSALHRGKVKFSLNDYMIYNITSQMEYEANTFAAELLFTDEQIEQLVRDGRDYIEMSKILGYDKRMLLFKLNSMKQRGYDYNLPESLDSLYLGK